MNKKKIISRVPKKLKNLMKFIICRFGLLVLFLSGKISFQDIVWRIRIRGGEYQSITEGGDDKH